MKLTFFFILFLFVVTSSCKKKEEVTPECIQSQITVFRNNSCEKDAKVKQYTFQGHTVFTFFMGYCGGDLSTAVLDENCNVLGYLGGLGATTKINGEEFSNATYIRTVWSR